MTVSRIAILRCSESSDAEPSVFIDEGPAMKKIFTATLGTETNTFSSLPTGLQLFQETCLFRKRSYGDKVPMFAAPLDVWRRLAEARGCPTGGGLGRLATPSGKTVMFVYEGLGGGPQDGRVPYEG